MPITLNGDTGITTPGLTNTGSTTLVNLTTTGNTILGDQSTDTLNVANGNLVLNSSGNLGIGTASPTTRLSITDSTGPVVRLVRTSNRFELSADTDFMSLNARDASTYITFKTADTERVRITAAGDVGIGTSSPNGTLQLSRNASLGNFLVFDDTRSGFGDWAVYKVGSNDLTFGYDTTAGSAPTQAVTLAYGGNVGIGTSSPLSPLDVVVGASGARRFLVNYDDSVITIKGANATPNPEALRLVADNFRFNTGTTGSGTEKMRLDLTGNLGLGVTPSAWWSSAKALQIAGSTGFLGFSGVNGNIVTNTYYDGSNYRYLATAAAFLYEQSVGHKWSIAPSGTAGNAITFTQAMTLFASGGVSIGNTTDLGAKSLNVGVTAASTNTLVGRINFQGYNTTYGAGMASYIPSDAPGIDWQDLRFYTSQGPSAINVERARIDSSGNLLVGTTSNTGAGKAFFYGTGGTVIRVGDSSNAAWRGYVLGASNGDSSEYGFLKLNANSGELQLYVGPNSYGGFQTFYTAGAERARIDGSGRMQIGTSSSRFSATLTLLSAANSYNLTSSRTGAGTGSLGHVVFETDSGAVGTIFTSGSSTSYNTSSDYRLKNTIAPMTGALAKVAKLKPVTYKWNADGSDGEGFIAHELAEVVPQAVTGEKDAVDENGTPMYQGIDVSFLVATLTAAIQELKSELDSVKTELAALKGN